MKRITMILSLLIGLVAYGQECNYRTNKVDEFTGSTKIVLNSEVFITHTDSALKKYFKRKDYLTTRIYSGRINETKFIYFDTKILSKKAYDYYGSLRSDANIMIKTDSGMVTLKIKSSDTGDVDYDRGFTKYSVYCVLEPEDVEILSIAKVSKVRIYWSKGYEDYDVKDSELLIRQFKCIK